METFVQINPLDHFVFVVFGGEDDYFHYVFEMSNFGHKNLTHLIWGDDHTFNWCIYQFNTVFEVIGIAETDCGKLFLEYFQDILVVCMIIIIDIGINPDYLGHLDWDV